MKSKKIEKCKEILLATSELVRIAGLVYPILLAREAGEISESKAAELLGRDIVSLREIRHRAIQGVIGLVESLPCGFSLLVESIAAKQKS